MRITSNMLTNNFMLNLQENLRRMEKSQNELSTGKKFTRPSDDPVAVTRSMQTRADLSKTEQYLSNIRDGITWLDQSENTLMEINELIKRAYELTVDAANGTKSPDDRKVIAQEIQQIQQQLVQGANASFNGRFLFGGYNTSSKPFEIKEILGENKLIYNGIDILDTVSNASLIEKAESESITYEVGPGLTMPVSYTGIQLFGSGEDNLFNVFNNLSKQLLDGTDQDGLNESVKKLQEKQNQVLAQLGELGGKYNRLTFMEKRFDQDLYNFKAVQSKIEDADYAKAVTDFKMAEIVYQSALAAAAKIMQPTLIDFLR